MSHYSILIFLIISSCTNPFKINQLKNGERHGKWIVYHEKDKKNIESIGRFKKGNQKGTWKYYNRHGTLIKTEKIKGKTIINKRFHENGKLSECGKAKITYTDSIIHYYYYGIWKNYDENGLLIKERYFKEGLMQNETDYGTKKNNPQNDSLTAIVKYLNEKFYKYNDSVRIAEVKFGKNNAQYKRVVSLQNLNAYEVYDEIDLILKKFGYPGKTLVGKEYAIIFSIISSSNLEIKEKYYNTIIDAADKGELVWNDVAFFVDKVKVAKKQKQIYGTQYKYDENYKILYYPIDEINLLNERREKVHLNKIDIKNIKETEY